MRLVCLLMLAFATILECRNIALQCCKQVERELSRVTQVPGAGVVEDGVEGGRGKGKGDVMGWTGQVDSQGEVDECVPRTQSHSVRQQVGMFRKESFPRKLGTATQQSKF